MPLSMMQMMIPVTCSQCGCLSAVPHALWDRTSLPVYCPNGHMLKNFGRGSALDVEGARELRERLRRTQAARDREYVTSSSLRGQITKLNNRLAAKEN